MKSTYLITAISVTVFVAFFIGKTTISFFPFKINLDRPFYTIGYILIMIGLLCMLYQDKKIEDFRLEVESVEDARDIDL